MRILQFKCIDDLHELSADYKWIRPFNANFPLDIMAKEIADDMGHALLKLSLLTGHIVKVMGHKSMGRGACTCTDAGKCSISKLYCTSAAPQVHHIHV